MKWLRHWLDLSSRAIEDVASKKIGPQCASSLASAETISLAVAAASAGHRKVSKEPRRTVGAIVTRSNAPGHAARQLVGTTLASKPDGIFGKDTAETHARDASLLIRR
jgi:hypothetical protein